MNKLSYIPNISISCEYDIHNFLAIKGVREVKFKKRKNGKKEKENMCKITF